MQNLIKFSVTKPKAIFAIVIAIVFFGIMALYKIAIQLTPDINKPIIQVVTYWPNNAPEEIEREIINQQEEVLKSVDGLEDMTSSAKYGSAEITLEFNTKQDMSKALILVANNLNRVESYPSEVTEPVIKTAGSEDNPIAWMVLKPKADNTTPISQYADMAEDVIKNRLERIPGIARVNIFGGSELELQVIIRAEVLASHGLTLVDLLNQLEKANISISAGDIAEGKRSYIIRTEADFSTIPQIEQVIVKTVTKDNGTIERVSVADIAKVQIGYKEAIAKIRHKSNPTIAINAVREYKANVLEAMAGLKAGITSLNNNELAANGLFLEQVYDETIYINSAIGLVKKNVIVGGILAASILFLFLRSIRATGIIALAIPVSVIGSFVAMAAFGRSINVISLAGIAFAVGMVVDAAIVVLENIYRHYERGETIRQAAIIGATEVWSAILVAALTTVAAFVPVLMLELEVGQLFRDIAVAISVAVMLSLIVAITVVPALGVSFFVRPEQQKKLKLPVIDNLGRKIYLILEKYINYVFANKTVASGIVIGILAFSIISIKVFLPKLEYLPEGNRNLIFGIILPPPGYNLETTFQIAKNIEQQVAPLWQDNVPKNKPAIANFFFVALNNLTYVGAIAKDPSRVQELIPIMSRAVFQNPGTYGFISQASLFGRNIGSGRTIDIDFSGPDLPKLLSFAKEAMYNLEQVLSRKDGNQFRPVPGLELGAPELRIIPNPVKTSDANLTNQDIALSVRALNDGLRAAEITVAGKRIDLTIKGEENMKQRTQDISSLPIITRRGDIVPLSALADVNYTAGPTEIKHKDGVRTVTIQVRPQANLALESAMELINTKLVAPMQTRANAAEVNIRLSGTADELVATWRALKLDLLLALITVYLVMVVLFESFSYPIIIIVTVPVALCGGILGLALLNIFTRQPLDMLTMLGFIILIGIIVNNAILIVNYTQKYLQQDANANLITALQHATKNRLRPIFMSTLTSLFGMFPLAAFPGAGSELYRGLGSVVLGGLALSAVITLIIIPALFALGHRRF